MNVNLASFPYFNNTSSLQRLNRHIKLHSDFMLHQLVAATGCTFSDALGILFLLYHFDLADAFLVIYHKNDKETPILITDFIKGPPEVPFINPMTEEIIHDPHELVYTFMFKLKTRDILFVFNEKH